MILSAAESLVYNGQRVQYALYNGERVWPVITGDWHTLSVTNQAEDVAIGLTATKDGTPVYERPVGSGDFTASIVEDSVVNMAVVNSAYYRPDINSTGISFVQTGAQTGDSSTSLYTALMAGDASVNIPSLHANDFFASGIFRTAVLTSTNCEIWSPAEMTYLSGDQSISALTPVFSGTYYKDPYSTSWISQHVYTAVPTFAPNVTFETYTASSWMCGGGTVYCFTNNTEMWAYTTAYMGNQYSTGYGHHKTTQYSKRASAYAAKNMSTFTISSQGAGSIPSGLYSYFGVRFQSNSYDRSLDISLNGYESSVWQVSGIAP